MKSLCFRLLSLAAILIWALVQSHALAQTASTDKLADEFRAPPRQAYPETWFHLIGGNVDREALSTDLEAVAGAGISGIQLFHGKGRAWPGVEPQIQTLSPTWDSLISHVAGETDRLGLKFTMQNCPGWAMSGGPWITPDNAMRHLVTSRQDIAGGRQVSIDLEVPQPSNEDWRDYQDVAVLAFPTPANDTGTWIVPDAVQSSVNDEPWNELLTGNEVAVQIPVARDEPTWVDFTFANPITLRSIELPPIELMMKRFNFDPDATITISVSNDGGWKELITHVVPRGNWQDRQSDVPLVLAVPDAKSVRYRIAFHNRRPMELSQLRLSTAARLQDWRGQAGYALRSLERAAPPEQSAAAWIQQDSIVDLTDRVDSSGHLDWDAPAGGWTVVRFGHVNTGVENKPAPPEATGFECDKLSPAGAEQHFAGYIGRLSKSGGAADGGRLRGMLIDSWECYTQTWTPEMEREFVSRRGYSLRPWLPALAGWVVNDHRSSERFLRDWRATISDLIVDNYYGRLAELGRERGLQLSFETSVGDVSPGDILQYFKSADIPMCEVWQPNDPHDGGLETKPFAPTASAAHIYGKPRVAAEAFTSVPMNWREHPFALKNVADRSFALGVTHMVFHTYTHNPRDEVPGTSFGSAIGTPFLRGQTWWKHMPAFTDYLARCGFLLEQGQPVADVLWYLGDDVDHKPRQDSPFPSGYHFDYVNADVLLTRLSVKDGDIVNPEGTRWRVLWLPRDHCRRMTPDTLQKIKELLMAGGTVIGEAPDMNPSLSDGVEADLAFENLVNEHWGDAASGDRRIGSGRLIWGGSLEESLTERDVKPDVIGTLPERWCHRRVGNTDIYFVIGDRHQSLDANLHFRSRGTPEFWDPVDGSVTPISTFKTTDDGTTIPVQLPVAGSIFVVFRPQPTEAGVERIALNGDVLLDVNDRNRIDTAAKYPRYGVSRKKPIQPWVEPGPLTIQLTDGGQRMVAWNDGEYEIESRNGETSSVEVSGAETIPLQSNWSLSFPVGWDTPASIKLDRVGPWSEIRDSGVRHFSGTANYQTTVTLDDVNQDDRFLLDLGQVGSIAKVTVNGHTSAVLWTWPFRTDITDFVQQGENSVSVEVTNTWHNRLVYDATQSPDKRKTWTIAGPPKDSPLDFSGLGPNVQLRRGKDVTLPTAIR
ncbi:Glycosyl hydrolases family 2, sugar binding domain [Rubripirellula tenax]|uniref:Glycosyl hydrolases family 2, sugar binding domain n=1 Tax=Rubripirellula tenax TaxID=2528015 RepID=A0A5C6F790_9BACT|nr:glycosyl hydrolase [Rubripirellula tenax]TWU57085.1 Glycosyl hydrolases family 2, sugar binding domain [Rubripirellula tenax]